MSSYLDVSVSPDVEVDATWRRVSRPRSHGEWRDWFLETDLDYVRATCPEFMAVFGYDHDWRTNDVRTVRHELTSTYVERIVDMRITGVG